MRKREMEDKAMQQKIPIVWAAILLVLLVVGGCGDPPKGGSPTPTPTPTATPSPTPSISVTVTATSVMAQIARTDQLTANVNGTTNKAVTWDVNGIVGGNSTVGTISSSGLYTAPNSVPNPNSITVTATSVADPSKSGSTSLTIAPLTMSYGYDQNGERVLASNGITTTIYPTKMYNTDGTNTTKHIFANGEVIATIHGSGSIASLSIVNTDHLTGSNVVSDISGNIQEVMDYHPFGATRIDEQHNFNEQRKFAGHEFDQDTGLSYMDARYYQPNRGQFLSEDPSFLATTSDLSDPQTLNAYAYSRNNPVVYLDPNGEWELDFRAIGSNIAGYGLGLAETGEIALESTTHAIFHPIQTAQGVEASIRGEFNTARDLIRNPSGTIAEDNTGFGLIYNEFESKTPFEQGRTIGHIFGQIEVGVITDRIVGGVIEEQAGDLSLQTAAKAGNELPTLSQRSIKHLTKHLADFRKFDSTFTVTDQANLGYKIISTGKKIGNNVWEGTTEVGGQGITVRAVRGGAGQLRSVFIVK